MTTNKRAAWSLVVLAPLAAEVSIGNLPLDQLWIVLFFVPIYGAGALFIRELVRRTGGGYPHLLIMGVGYGLIEEGLALQSLTSPHLYGAAEWAPRLLGVNTAYTELNLIYHAVFSVAVPVALVEVVHGTRPFLRRGGLITSGVVAVLGALLVRVSVPPVADPGYVMPRSAVIIVALVATAVFAVGLRGRFPTPRLVDPPRPLPAAGITAVAALGFLGMIWPFGGAEQPLFTHGAWALLPMAGAALIVAATVWTLGRWRWTRRHLVAACTGALVGHTLFGLAENASTVPERAFLLAVLLVTVAGGALLGSGRGPLDAPVPAVPSPAPPGHRRDLTGSPLRPDPRHES
ncbi:hypothetical protein [Actinoplanes sp. NPDC051851]|uniref:hypothetical protein n=1 Tax=Actinoplanes sp. NPDC051851 TaxID=3154753 RepID=UPI0034453286